VAFQVELGFQGLVDGLDDLTERFQEPTERPLGLLGADLGPDQGDAALVEFGLERS
jgi:hypothetical protein